MEGGEGLEARSTEIAEGPGAALSKKKKKNLGDVMSPDARGKKLQGESEELSKIRGAVLGVSGLFWR